MYTYTIIDSDMKMDDLLASWRNQHITTIAMDFEGEFNLHIYGEHLCLVQMYDAAQYYLVDPFKVSAEALRRLLESSDLQKLMFDCSSDSALVRKEFGITLTNVYDVYLTAKMLGIDGNLSALTAKCLNRPQATGKKSNQMANWLVRPLRLQQIEYALSDVEHLFAIREVLDKEAAAQALGDQIALKQRTVALPKGPDKPGWEKLSEYRYLSNKERIYLKWFFEARDMLAQKLNVPAVRVLEKHKLAAMARSVPSDPQAFHLVVHHKDPRIENDLVALLTVAKEGAEKQIGEQKTDQV